MKINKSIFTVITLLIVLILSVGCDNSTNTGTGVQLPSWLKNEKWIKESGNSEDYIFTTDDDIYIAEYSLSYYSLKEEVKYASSSSSHISDDTYSIHWETHGEGTDTEGNDFNTKGVYTVSFTLLNPVEISLHYERELTKGDEITYVETSGTYRRP